MKTFQVYDPPMCRPTGLCGTEIDPAVIKDRPFDVVNLKPEVSTLKGALERTPSHMNFEVTSTEQRDITAFLVDVRQLVRDNQLVLINETRL